MILMCLRMSSSYPIDTPCVEREDEDFFYAQIFPAKFSCRTSHYYVLLGNKKAGGSIYLSARGVNLDEYYRLDRRPHGDEGATGRDGLTPRQDFINNWKMVT